MQLYKIFLFFLCMEDGRGSPEIKRKSTFQQELESTLKDRKKRGLATGFSDTGDDSSSEGGGLGADDGMYTPCLLRSTK